MNVVKALVFTVSPADKGVSLKFASYLARWQPFVADVCELLVLLFAAWVSDGQTEYTQNY